MNIAQIENNLQELLKSFDRDTFIYDLISAYGLPKSTITRLQRGGLNLSKLPDEVAWKKKLFFKSAVNEDIHELFSNIKVNARVNKHDPRFIIVTDFDTLLAFDSKTTDTLDIPILELAKHFDFFLPWAGMEKAQHHLENPADVKAAEKMAKLYDEIRKDNPAHTQQEVHNLNVFLTRLLFCFFAEDTGIFEQGQFTNSIGSHTQQDGSDLNTYLDRLFGVMNINYPNRENLPAYLSTFPFVNGGLLRNYYPAPIFSRRSRQTLIDCGGLQWKDINPDIFGSMIQAVVTPENRGGLGMHYTSVPNIMKVIRPLFVDELYEEFFAATGNSKKLYTLLYRIYRIKIFDPACGSGNFLIIAYKELRKLEMRIFKILDHLKGELGSGILDFQDNSFSKVTLNNFYGIEIDDFAHEVAILSLWLAEHQMNQVFFQEFGRTKPALPLIETGNIVHGNATRLDWEVVCPKNEGDEIFILGNPQFKGSRNQDSRQKEDMKLAFSKDYKSLDYVACWFLKGSQYITNFNAQLAFVSTNSICQGEQVSLIWERVLNDNLELGFAYNSFKWSNNAKGNAAVIVVIVGVRNKSQKPKILFSSNRYSIANNINPYLTQGKSIYVTRRSTSISGFPICTFGSMPNDGGNLLLNNEEYDKLINDFPQLKKYIKQYIGADDFLNGGKRWCLVIEDSDIEELKLINPIADRFKKIEIIRNKSSEKSTRDLAKTPHKFYFFAHQNTDSIIIPSTTSERRDYIPIGFLNSNSVISNSAQAIYGTKPFLFAVFTSRIHNVWIKAIAGRLKSDMRYSSSLVYNNFPFPQITDSQKSELEKHVYNLLTEREKHSEKTLAQLYDPDKMPDGLREAHRQNDLAVERCYRSKPFESDEERLEYLFKLYEQMIAEEKERGSLFKAEKKIKRKKR